MQVQMLESQSSASTEPYVSLETVPAVINHQALFKYLAALEKRKETSQFLPTSWANLSAVSLELWVEDAEPGIAVLLKSDGTWCATAQLVVGEKL